MELTLAQARAYARSREMMRGEEEAHYSEQEALRTERKSRGYLRLPLIHELPKGCAASLFRSGYGRFVIELQTPHGEFIASGDSDVLALERARKKASQAAAELQRLDAVVLDRPVPETLLRDLQLSGR